MNGNLTSKERRKTGAEVPAPDNLSSRKLQAAARREQILLVALRLFAERGFKGTSTREIAKAIGVTEGLIFRYFPDKRSLLLELATRSDSTAASRSIHLLDENDERPASEVLTEVANAWLSLSRDELALTRMLLREASVDPDLASILNSVISRALRRFTEYIRARIDAGELRTDLRPQDAAYSFLAQLMAPLLLPLKRKAAVQSKQLVDLWLTGCKT